MNESTEFQPQPRIMEAQFDPLIGAVVENRYEISGIIAQGGMSIIYKARCILSGVDCAIKALSTENSDDGRFIERFKREAQVMISLEHPNIINEYSFGLLPDGRAYMALEFLAGMTLQERLAADGLVHPNECVPWFIEMCDGLDHAHQRDVIHRDIKPSNIFVLGLDDGRNISIKILDFGISRRMSASQDFTQPGQVYGSPPYMSPEQCKALQLDVRSDIYSFGCVMYHCLVGIPPLLGEYSFETMSKHVNELAPGFGNRKTLFGISDKLEAIVLKCLAKEPEARYQSMLELREQLQVV